MPNEASAYAQAGFRIIPIAPGQKTPSTLLPERKWGQYQSVAPTLDEVTDWDRRAPDGNWALICGNGLGLGDCDDRPASEWILANPGRPLFLGACIVRTGHGKAHIWFEYTVPAEGDFLSTKWPMVPGVKMGDIRAKGNYALVPPSRLADGGAYVRVAGSMGNLPRIPDPARFLESIVAAYLAEWPRARTEVKDSDKTILAADAATFIRLRSRIDREKFKKNITDTLFVKGNQDPGTRHWSRLNDPSHSAIDFAVCCEFIRKGWDFFDIEEIFANTLVGEACYQDRARANHGRGYLHATWRNAEAQVLKDRAALDIPQGANFTVTQASRLERSSNRRYTLTLQGSDSKVWGTMDIDSGDLATESAFRVAVFKALGVHAQMKSAQQGREFLTFAAAVHKLSDDDVRYPPHTMTDQGRLQARIKRTLQQMVRSLEMPENQAATRRLGWRIGEEYWVRSLELIQALENARSVPRLDDVWVALEGMAEARMVTIRWPDAEEEDVLYVRLSERPAF